jgi:hypothetical protein
MRHVLGWAVVVVILAVTFTWASDDWGTAAIGLLILVALEVLYRLYVRPAMFKRRASKQTTA